MFSESFKLYTKGQHRNLQDFIYTVDTHAHPPTCRY